MTPTRRRVEWAEFDLLCSVLAENVRHKAVDLIIGVARGGLPVAVCLSHKLNCRPFGTVLLTKTRSEEAFAVNPIDTFAVSDLLLPTERARTILIVDDIVAIGDAFTAIDVMLRHRCGSEIQILHTALFADVSQVESGPYARLLESLYFGENIDNKATWIVFPWEDH